MVYAERSSTVCLEWELHEPPVCEEGQHSSLYCSISFFVSRCSIVLTATLADDRVERSFPVLHVQFEVLQFGLDPECAPVANWTSGSGPESEQ
jgi:hypothetical protein